MRADEYKIPHNRQTCPLCVIVNVPTNLTDFEKISHLIRFGLSFRKMTTNVITGWAYKKINEQTYDAVFSDLATAETKNKIIEVLSGKVVWNYNDREIRNLILSYYKKYLISNPTLWMDIEKELTEYFQYSDFENGNDRLQDFLYYLTDDWNLRKDGFSGLLTMPEYLADNLSEYNGYHKLKELLKEQGLAGYEV